MKSIIHACIWCLALSVSAALPAWAISTVPSLPTYDYTLNLPELQPTDGGYQETGSTFQLEFSWIGPMQTDSSGPLSCCTVLGSPVAGYNFSGSVFTTDLTDTDPEVILRYSDGSGDLIVFAMMEPNSFWATLGPQTFASADPPTVASPGAGWEYLPGLDPGCSNCSVNTSATPEPGAFGLAAISLTGLILTLRRRK